MISEQEAIGLLKKYEVPEHIIKHCRAVTKAALEIAEKNKDRNPDFEKIKIAALLHDIGRVKTLRGTPTEEFGDNRHERHSVEILKKEGLDEIAEIVSKHGFMLADYKPEDLTIEEKILVVADSIAKDQGRITPNDRWRRIENKYTKTGDEVALKQFERSISTYFTIVDELGIERGD